MTTPTNLHLSEAPSWENASAVPFSGKPLPGAQLFSHSGSFGKIDVQKTLLPGSSFYKITTHAALPFLLSASVNKEDLAVIISFNQVEVNMKSLNSSLNLAPATCLIIYHNEKINFKFSLFSRNKIFLILYNNSTVSNLLRLVQKDQLGIDLHKTKTGVFHIDHEIASVIHSVRNCIYPETARTFFIQSRLNELLLHFLFLIGKPISTSYILLDEKKKTALEKAEHLLSANNLQKISIRQLAKKVMINPTDLNILFRQKHGQTIHEYKISKRMELAKEMLMAGKSVKEVAIYFGYRPSDFIIVFSRCFGFTPGSLKIDRNQ